MELKKLMRWIDKGIIFSN